MLRYHLDQNDHPVTLGFVLLMAQSEGHCRYSERGHCRWDQVNQHLTYIVDSAAVPLFNLR